MSPVSLAIDSSLEGQVLLAHVQAWPVQVAAAGDELLAAIESRCAELRARFAGRTPGEIEEMQAARRLYKSFGIDPTKTRPSSEALLRRILKDKPFPNVSNAVDFCNLSAIRSLLPLGLYDVDKIRGDVVLRRGHEGESYPGIRKGDVHVGGRPAFADAQGAFGNPTSDSLRTSVDSSTTAVWMVFLAPGDFDRGLLEEYLDEAARDMRRFLAGLEGPVETLQALAT